MSGIMNMFVAAKTTIATAVDEFFNRVTLLLNTSSTNGAQNNTFLDSSTNNFTITRNGNTTQGTFTPFSQTGWGNYFNGTGSGPYIRFGSSSALTFGTGDFTIEFWVNFLSINDGTVNYIYDMRDGGSGSFFVGEPSNTWTYINGAGNSVTTGMTSSTFSANQWYHVAICRASGVINFYVNGTKVSSNPADTSNYSTTYLSIMSRSSSDGANNNTNAYTSNFRVVKGTAVYTSNFTPSTTPLTAISGTSLLTCQANRFVDNSGNALTVAVDSSLTPSVQAFSPFLPTAAYDAAVVGGSGYFDGSGDYLITDASSNLTPGSGDFTAECWCYAGAVVNDDCILDITNNTSVGLMLFQRSNNALGVYNRQSSTVIITTANNTLIPNQWQHLVVQRSGSTVTVYIDGVSKGTATDSTNFTGNKIAVASYSEGGGYYTGYVSGVRFLKGTALYSSTFTPPTAPPTAITNTQLLLNYTNAGIYDSAAKNVLETVGNAQVSTTQAKWGTTSMYFDGTGDNLFGKSTDLLSFGTGDFTIEMWVNPASIPAADKVLIDTRASGSDSGYTPYINGGTLKMYSGAADRITSTSNISANVWTHIAFVRSSGTMAVYINGTQSGTATYTGSITCPGNIFIGSGFDGAANFNGYIDDLRITKGYARYTSSFTAPTAAFPLN